MDNINSEYILEIVKQGSFSKAAEKLYISQPCLSRYIKKLEEKLEVIIFDRSKLPIKLTTAGVKIVEYIHESNELKEKLNNSLYELKLNANPEIKIGIISWLIPILLPGIIYEFKKINPTMNFTVIEDRSFSLENMVLENEIDACIINGPQTNTILQHYNLMQQKLKLLVPITSQIAVENYDFENDQFINSTLKLSSLKNYRFIMLNETSRIGRLARDMFKLHKITTYNITEVVNLNTSVNMCAAGLGLTFVPESYIYNKHSNLLFSIEKPDSTFYVTIVYNEEKLEQNKHLKQFINFIKERNSIKTS